jgi:hypothetical protein
LTRPADIRPPVGAARQSAGARALDAARRCAALAWLVVLTIFAFEAAGRNFNAPEPALLVVDAGKDRSHRSADDREAGGRPFLKAPAPVERQFHGGGPDIHALPASHAGGPNALASRWADLCPLGADPACLQTRRARAPPSHA